MTAAYSSQKQPGVLMMYVIRHGSAAESSLRWVSLRIAFFLRSHTTRNLEVSVIEGTTASIIGNIRGVSQPPRSQVVYLKSWVYLLSKDLASRVSVHSHISPQGSRNYKKKRPSPEAPPLV